VLDRARLDRLTWAELLAERGAHVDERSRSETAVDTGPPPI
jgi:hypothetical protein